MDGSILADLLGDDPIPWILGSDEPFAVFAARADVMLEDPGSPDVRQVRLACLQDERVRGLVDELPIWGAGDFPGHHSPAFVPNRLNLLADMGMREGDDPRVDDLLGKMADHRDAKGRFQSFGKTPGRPKPEWGSLLCDTNVITDVLVRFGLQDDERVRVALAQIIADVAVTPQGKAWQCIPEKRTLWRGPGRKADVCPQVTLEGLRALSHLTEDERPEWMLDAARTPLEVWRRRTEERPYMFGHGYQFKSVKWPNFWYDVLWVLETVSRFPRLWTGPDATDADRRSLAELAACLIAYNFDGDGRLTPRRSYRGFAMFSFGQKREPSPFATARALVPLVRLLELAPEIRDVDVESLPSSTGGAGASVPPKRGEQTCPVPTRVQRFGGERAVPRVLARHHIGNPWYGGSVESVVADIVGLNATTPTTPYVALRARLPRFARDDLDAALYERRSLARIRCMRGGVFVVRRDLLPAAFAATREATSRFARAFGQHRGVTTETYDELAPEVLRLVEEGPLPTADIRDRLRPPDGVDVAALVNIMCTECLLLKDRPLGDWQDRRWTYTPFAEAFPDIRLDGMSAEDAAVHLLRAYVRAFGPATDRDAAWWTGLGPRRVGRALEALGDEIVGVVLDDSDRTYLMHAADLDELGAASLPAAPSVELLPSFDPFVMGHTRRERYLADEHRRFVFDRSGNAAAVVLGDGRVIGVWDTDDGPEPTVLVHLFEETSDRLVDATEARSYEMGRFWFDSDVSVRFVESMCALSDRPAGAVTKPLRLDQA